MSKFKEIKNKINKILEWKSPESLANIKNKYNFIVKLLSEDKRLDLLNESDKKEIRFLLERCAINHFKQYIDDISLLGNLCNNFYSLKQNQHV